MAQTGRQAHRIHKWKARRTVKGEIHLVLEQQVLECLPLVARAVDDAIRRRAASVGCIDRPAGSTTFGIPKALVFAQTICVPQSSA